MSFSGKPGEKDRDVAAGGVEITQRLQAQKVIEAGATPGSRRPPDASPGCPLLRIPEVVGHHLAAERLGDEHHRPWPAKKLVSPFQRFPDDGLHLLIRPIRFFGLPFQAGGIGEAVEHKTCAAPCCRAASRPSPSSPAPRSPGTRPGSRCCRSRFSASQRRAWPRAFASRSAAKSSRVSPMPCTASTITSCISVPCPNWVKLQPIGLFHHREG